MASLLDLLSLRNGNEPLVYFRGNWLSVADLLQRARELRTKHPVAAGANAIFRATDQLDAIVGIVALDGFARQTFISSNRSNLVAEGLFKEAVGDYLSLSIDSQASAATTITSGETTSLETTWIIPTSGTPGTPKLVQHSLESLTRSIRKDPKKGAGIIWGQLYEISRFAGLQVLFQSLLGGSSLALATELREPGSIGKTFRSAGVTALSATPTMWRRLLMAGALDDLNLSIVTLGGEATDDMLLGELASKFPEARISHIYASTEAGVGFSVSDRKAGFPADFLDQTLPNGVRLKVDKNGRLFLRRPDDKTSYLGGNTVSEDDGWIDSGDLVERIGDRYIFLGRANGTINVGGMKVQPSQIEQVLQSHPGVALVAVSARKNPFTGNLVQATIVPSEQGDHAQLKRDLIEFCGQKLEKFKMPAVWKFVEELPISSTGKILRS